MFIFTIIFILFIIILTINLRKNSRIENEAYDQFWEKERNANTVRKQDISKLSYIKIPLESFPIGNYSEAALTASEAVLTELSEKSILNLNGISNTDLKLTYGVQNLNFLSECDDNFALLAKTLVDYGKCLFELGHYADAQLVLDFGIESKSDIIANYTLLSEIYKLTGQSEALSDLIAHAEQLESPRKTAILAKLMPIEEIDTSKQD